MTSLVVFDSSIFVDLLRAGRHQERIANTRGIIRNCSVVLAELWRGATMEAERRFLSDLARNHPIFTPTEANWIESGEVLNKIRVRTGFSPAKLRDLHFDVLIALTVRSHGARLITSNRQDFELIGRFRKFEMEVWP